MSLSKEDKQLLVSAGNLADAACDLALQEAENVTAMRKILMEALEVMKALTLRIIVLELEVLGEVSSIKPVTVDP